MNLNHIKKRRGGMELNFVVVWVLVFLSHKEIIFVLLYLKSVCYNAAFCVICVKKEQGRHRLARIATEIMPKYFSKQSQRRFFWRNFWGIKKTKSRHFKTLQREREREVKPRVGLASYINVWLESKIQSFRCGCTQAGYSETKGGEA